MTDNSPRNEPDDASTQQMPKAATSTPAKSDSSKGDSPKGEQRPGLKKTTGPSGAPPVGKQEGESAKEPRVSARQPLGRPAADTPTSDARKPLSGLSKDDYSRTTGSRPDTTAVMPAVRDGGSPTPQSKGEGVSRSGASVKGGTAPAQGQAGATTPTRTGEKKRAASASASAATTSVEPRSSAAGPVSSTDHTMRLRHIEPWSVTRLAFVVSVALMIVAVVAVAVFWLVLQITGVWSALNDSVSNILSDDASGFDITDYFGFGRLVGLTLILSALNVVFMTALATIAAHLYNLAAQILGGIRISVGGER